MVTIFTISFFTKNPGENDLNSVLAWDPVAETWSEAGRLVQARYLHAITALPLAALGDFCD